ncbi:3-hydroxyacyl-CoA dehydrogenase family protein [Halobacteriovorax sp. HLS]|uniref:3-hydroxyacyl-CoA dehydrogenase family protein n=1 Tax=Halobacteriovorax sp. HLS TaxID=2234000 RepID=UPI000FDC2010|nr:3-hydroxyacyl-CoA dehydrogenase family protein [Halobacteriovorax sp. HLS]
MTTNRNFLVLATKNHPMYEQLKALDVSFYDIEDKSPFEDKRSHYSDYDYIMDFSLTPIEKKVSLLKNLRVQSDCPIVSDLACYWGEQLFETVKTLKGAISLSFPSPKNTHEYFAADEETNSAIEEFHSLLGLNSIRVKSAGIGFTYPRVISMVINEAYFSLEDGLAEEKDIDTAMKFGVNYPLGPFQWAKSIGAKNILMLLDTLYDVTRDQRYRASSKLRLAASKI